MKEVNIREVRRRLEFGDLAEISAKTGISARRVGEVLNKGRNSGGCRDAVLGAALDVLKGKGVGRELLISKAEDLKLSTADIIPIPYRPRKKSGKFLPRRRGISPVILVIGSAAAFLLLFGKGLLAKSK